MGTLGKPLMRRRGFISRLGAAAALALLGGVFLMLSSVSADQKPVKTAAENHALYSGWQADSDRQAAALSTEIKIGSFRLHRPDGETFVGGLSGTVYDVLSAVPPRPDELEHYLQARARSRLTTTDEPEQTFSDYLRQRAHGVPQQLLRDGTDYLNDALRRAVSRQTADVRFLHNVEVDLQTPLGERRGSGGLSALGALRETNSDVIAWQLRGYVAEESSKGANAGLIYRRAANLGGDALFGGNVFLDLEHHGESGENFWRWSVGGEYRNAYFDFYANYYVPITDAITRKDKVYYTQEGLDVELNADILNSRYGSLAGGLGYYNWQGIRDEPDDSGLRYHLRVSPDSGNFQVELQLDVPEEGSAEWGGRVSYRHFIDGAAPSGNRSLLGSESTFDARDYFFDPVRREYAQRIKQIVITEVQVKATAGSAQLRRAGAPDPINLGADSAAVILPRPMTASLATDASGRVELSQVNAWMATLYESSTVSMYLRNDNTALYLAGGSLNVTRRSTPMTVIVLDNNNRRVTIGLHGTRCHFTAGQHRRLVCDEGELRATLTNFADLAMYYGGSSVTIHVDYPDPDDQDNMRTLPLHCNSAESRMRHREMNENFPGCFGDARVNMPDTGNNMVEVVSEGRTLTIETRTIDGEMRTIIKSGVVQITLSGTDSIPLNPDNLRLIANYNNLGMVELLVPVANYRPALDAADLMPQSQIYEVLGGKDFQFSNGRVVAQSDSSDGNCDPDYEPGPGEPLLSCGDIGFGEIDAEEPFYQIYARTGEPKVVTLDAVGGSGRFRVALHRRSGNILVQTETFGTVDDKILLTISAAVQGNSEYLLEVAEGKTEYVLADTTEPVAVILRVNVADSLRLSAPAPSAPISVATRLRKNTEIYSGSFRNILHSLKYEVAYGNDAERERFEFSRDVGSNRFMLNLSGVPFPEPIDAEVTIIATDTGDNKKATLIITVHARAPGPLNYYVSYSRSGHVNYSNVEIPEYDRAAADMSNPDAIQLYVDIYGHKGVSGGGVTFTGLSIQRETQEFGFLNTGNFRIRRSMDNGYQRVAVLIGDRQGRDIHCGRYKFVAIVEDEYAEQTGITAGHEVRIEREFRVVDAVSAGQEGGERCQSMSPSEFSAPLVSGPLLIHTQVPTERAIYSGEFGNARGRITYDEPTFSSNDGDFTVEATDGNRRVVIRNRGHNPLLGSTLPEDQRPFRDEANITISLVATDSYDGSKATLVITVEARDPDSREIRFTPGGAYYDRTIVEDGLTWYVYRGQSLNSRTRGRQSSHFLGRMTHPFFNIGDGFSLGYGVRRGFSFADNGDLRYWDNNAPPSLDVVRRVQVRLVHSRVGTVTVTVRIRIENPDYPPLAAPQPSGPLLVNTQIGRERNIFSGTFENVYGRLTYTYSRSTFSSHSTNFEIRNSGNRVWIRNRGAGPGAIEHETDITIRYVATDSAGRQATLVATVEARDPNEAGIVFTPDRSIGFLRTEVEGGNTVYVYRDIGGQERFITGVSRLPGARLGQLSTPLFEGRADGFSPARRRFTEVRASGGVHFTRYSAPSTNEILVITLATGHSRVPQLKTTLRIRIDNPYVPHFVAPRSDPVTIYTQVARLGTYLTLEVEAGSPYTQIHFTPLVTNQAISVETFSERGSDRRVYNGLVYRLNSQIANTGNITISYLARESSASSRDEVTVLVTFHVRDPGPEAVTFIPRSNSGFLRTISFSDNKDKIWHVYHVPSIRNLELGQFSHPGIDAEYWEKDYVRAGYIIKSTGVFETRLGRNHEVSFDEFEIRLNFRNRHSRAGSAIIIPFNIVVCIEHCP